MKIAVRAVIAVGPRCFRWMFEMLSGPVAFEILAFWIMDWTSDCRNVGGRLWLILIFDSLFAVSLLAWIVGLKLMAL